MRKFRLRQMKVLVVLALCALSTDRSWGAESVEFTNKGKDLLYVRTVTGDGSCPGKPSPIRDDFSLAPGEKQFVDAVGAQKEICYVVSTNPDVNQFPIGCGVAVGPSIVDVASAKSCHGLKLVEGSKYAVGAAVANPALTNSVEFNLGSWNDPLTPPQTATRCVREAWGHWPWCEDWRTCVEWATDCRFLRNELFLIVTSPDPAVSLAELKARSESCIQDASIAAAVAGVLTAYVSGGSAAIAAAEKAFTTVFVSCMSGIQDVGVRFEVRSHWTSWGSCG